MPNAFGGAAYKDIFTIEIRFRDRVDSWVGIFMDGFREIRDWKKRLMACDVHWECWREIPLSLCCSCAMLPSQERIDMLKELYY